MFFCFLYSGLTARDIIQRVSTAGQALFFRFFLPFIEPTIVAQVHVKNLAGPTGRTGHNEPHVSGDLHVALVALAGFVVHGGYSLTVWQAGSTSSFSFLSA